MKTCFKCGALKPLNEFYKHPMMADGHVGKCKECNKADVVANRLKRVEYYRAYDTERYSTEEGHRKLSIACRKWRSKNQRKYAAHSLLAHAIKVGKVNRKPCCICGNLKSHGHHENYDKPLEVVWLCAVCHSARHKEMKTLGIIP